MATSQRQFPSVWIVVVAVVAQPGEQLEPCMLVATDFETKQVVEISWAIPRQANGPPYPTSAECLLVTIDATALAGCHFALGWPAPARIIDLLQEFRNATNSRPRLAVGGLAGALLWFGISTAGTSGATTSSAQLRRRLDAVTNLFQAMRPSLDLGRALLRGRYLIAAARIEAAGVPIDQKTVRQLTADWPVIRDRVVGHVDREFGFYSGGRFDPGAFATWLARRAIAWPRVETGQFDLSDDTFSEMARIVPELRPIKELRRTLHRFDPVALTIGRDGRNRTPLRPFASRTGRNQPSAKASVLGTAAWVRHLIKPQSGTGLALIDWQQQEFAIAAALSGDPAMQQAYCSGDPFIALAVDAGAAPAGATMATHSHIRERFKACALGIQYGMGTARLARQLGLHDADARELQRRHRAAFPRFWAWSDGVETYALLHRELQSVFGWRLAVGQDANPLALRNFPMQANGAEMLRLACCLATEAGIRVCAPIHDALLIEAPIRDLDDTIATTRHLMADASAIVLDGFALRTSVRAVRAPDRWTDQRGQSVWSAIEGALGVEGPPVHQRHETCSPVNPRTVLLYESKEDGSNASD